MKVEGEVGRPGCFQGFFYFMEFAVVKKGTKTGKIYKCLGGHYRSFDFGVNYREEIKDLMTGTPVSEWVKNNPEHWLLIGEL